MSIRLLLALGLITFEKIPLSPIPFRLLLAVAVVAGLIAPLSAQNAGREFHAEVVPQLGHSNSISSVAFSSDGRNILTGSTDKSARLWDAETGRELRKFLGHAGSVLSVAFAPDGLTTITGGQDKTARLWDNATGRELRQFTGHTDSVISVAFSPDGRTVLTGSFDKTARLWDVATGRELRQFIGHEDSVSSVAFASDARTLLTGSWDKAAKLWDTASGRELQQFKGHAERVSSVAFAPDGLTLLTGGQDKTARLWDAATGRELRQFSTNADWITSVAFAPDGRTILMGSRTVLSGSQDKTARLWDVATGRELQQFAGHEDWVSSVTFSPDGRTILTGSEDRTALLWDAVTGREIRQFKGHASSVTSVSFSPNGQTVLTGDSNQTARLWDVTTGRALRQFLGHTNSVTSVAFAPDGRSILTGSWDKTVRLWDVATGRELRQFLGHTTPVSSVVFAPDGRTILTGSRTEQMTASQDNTVRLWDVETGRETQQISGNRNWISSVAFAPDGRTILTGGRPSIEEGRAKAAQLWDLTTGRELKQSPEYTSWVFSVSFSPNGRSALTGDSGRKVRLWDIATGRELRQFLGHTNSVSSVAFAPDGQTILTGGWDKTARLWDVASGRELRQFLGHTNSISSVAFAPGGRTILTGGLDKTARLWSAVTGNPLISMMSFVDGGWLTITPEGFFDASSPQAAQNLNVVRGFEVSSVDQVYNALYRPDLVREKLAGDPNGKVKAAAELLDLDKVMASGTAPRVAITSPASGSSSATDEVVVEATVADQGGGIGKVEWRVNGVTLGLEARGLERIDAPASGAAPSGRSEAAKRTLSLEPGDNRIEIVAYNARGLIASDPALLTLKWDGAKTATLPKLHVLAVGVNDYYDSRLRLTYAVPDATAFAEGLKKAGSGLYASVEVKTVLDKDVTLANLDKTFAEMSQKVQPRDVFVFFLAGHGKTKNGRYYFLPRDFRYEDDNSIEKAGMGQDKFQAWFASIPARKSLLLYDTCESGSLTGANARGSDVDERLGALNRMARATGRTFLTATTDDAPALEGYRGHGVFTYALLDALDRADVNKNGLIEVSELADYIDQKVPDYSFEAFKLRQIPQRSIVGNNFALANRAEILARASALPKTTPQQFRPR